MDVRVKKVHVQANAASRDLQDVVTEIAVNYHVQPESALTCTKWREWTMRTR